MQRLSYRQDEFQEMECLWRSDREGRRQEKPDGRQGNREGVDQSGGREERNGRKDLRRLAEGQKTARDGREGRKEGRVVALTISAANPRRHPARPPSPAVLLFARHVFAIMCATDLPQADCLADGNRSPAAGGPRRGASAACGRSARAARQCRPDKTPCRATPPPGMRGTNETARRVR